MPSLYKLYVIDEGKINPSAFEKLSDQQKHEKLVSYVETNGSMWADFEVQPELFPEILEAIDEEIGGTKFLPVFAYNHSPHNILGNDGDCPAFGYFTPEQAGDLHALLGNLAADEGSLNTLLKNGGSAMERIFNAFQSAAEEATERNYAIAVLHL